MTDEYTLKKAFGEIRHMIWGLFSIIIGSAILFSLSLWNNQSVSEQNQEAIRVACTLLANAIVESGAGGQGITREISTLAFKEILRDYPEGKDKQRLLTLLRERGNRGVTVPPCKQIIKDPSQVKDHYNIP